MTSLKNLSVSRKDLVFIVAENIKEIEGFNYRTQRANREQLKAQILEAGCVKVAITGFIDKGFFYVVSGMGRVSVTQELIAEGHEIKPIPVLNIKKPVTDDDWAELYLSQIIDNDSESLDPIGLANLCNDLKTKYGWTNRKIAEKTGRKEAIVGRYLNVLSDAALNEIANSEDSPSITLIADTQIEHGTDASAILTEATAIAKTEGKPRATRSHVDKALKANPRKPSNNPMSRKSEIQIIRELIETLLVDQLQRDMGDTVHVEVDKALWIKLQKAVNLET